MYFTLNRYNCAYVNKLTSFEYASFMSSNCRQLNKNKRYLKMHPQIVHDILNQCCNNNSTSQWRILQFIQIAMQGNCLVDESCIGQFALSPTNLS